MNEPDDFDPMQIAVESVQFAKRLGVEPIAWQLGSLAYMRLLELTHIGISPISTPAVTIGLFLGIPYTVDLQVNPWTIHLKTSKDH